MLQTETNTPEVEWGILLAARVALQHGDRCRADFEHGQWWLTNIDTGEQWSVVDSNAPYGFSFDRVTPPDDEDDGDGEAPAGWAVAEGEPQAAEKSAEQPPHWTVASGRELRFDGKPVFHMSIDRNGAESRRYTYPWTADTLAYVVALALNVLGAPLPTPASLEELARGATTIAAVDQVLGGIGRRVRGEGGSR